MTIDISAYLTEVQKIYGLPSSLEPRLIGNIAILRIAKAIVNAQDGPRCLRPGGAANRPGNHVFGVISAYPMPAKFLPGSGRTDANGSHRRTARIERCRSGRLQNVIIHYSYVTSINYSYYR